MAWVSWEAALSNRELCPPIGEGPSTCPAWAITILIRKSFREKKVQMVCNKLHTLRAKTPRTKLSRPVVEDGADGLDEFGDVGGVLPGGVARQKRRVCNELYAAH